MNRSSKKKSSVTTNSKLNDIFLTIPTALTILLGGFEIFTLWKESLTFRVYFYQFLLLFFVIASFYILLSKKTAKIKSKDKRSKRIINQPKFSKEIRITVLIVNLLVAIFLFTSMVNNQISKKKYILEQKEKIIILIAEIQGPEESFGLRNKIIEELRNDFENNSSVEIIPYDEIITVSQGSDYALKIGKEYYADIVLWGWYLEASNPNVTIHFEYPFPEELSSICNITNENPQTNYEELNEFTFQPQVAEEISALVSFIGGLIEYQSKNYLPAVKYFSEAKNKLPSDPRLFTNFSHIYFFRGLSNLHLSMYDNALSDFEQTTINDSQYACAYFYSGTIYYDFGSYDKAVEEYSNTILKNPLIENAFINRGHALTKLGKADEAINDYKSALNLTSDKSERNYLLGLINETAGEYTIAIDYFSKAIDLDPSFINAFLMRGLSHYELGQRELIFVSGNPNDPTNLQIFSDNDEYSQELVLAIGDFSEVIRKDPKCEEAYVYRGIVNAELHNYQEAINDFTFTIQLNPENHLAYFNRGRVYEMLGDDYHSKLDYEKNEELLENHN